MPARTSTRKRFPNRRIRNSRSRNCGGNTLTQKGGGKKRYRTLLVPKQRCLQKTQKHGGGRILTRTKGPLCKAKIIKTVTNRKRRGGHRVILNSSWIRNQTLNLSNLELTNLNDLSENLSTFLENNQLTELDVHNNNLGKLVIPFGWRFKKRSLFSGAKWIHSDGRKQKEMPLQPVGVIALMNVIKTSRSLASLNISANNIGQFDLFPEGWSYGLKKGYTSIYEYTHTDGRKQGGPPAGSKSSGVIALADAIKNNRSLVKLRMTNNLINGFEAGKALREMLADNKVLKELDLSHQGNSNQQHKLDATCVKELAVGLGQNETLESLNISGNGLTRGQLKPYSEGAQGVTLEDYWGVKDTHYETDMDGLEALIDGIKRNNTLTSLHIGDNNIPTEYMNRLISTVKEKSTMQMFCAVPFKDKTIRELDVSGHSLGVEGALVISDYLTGHPALTKLNISNTKMYTTEAGTALAAALANNSILEELNVSSNNSLDNAIQNPGCGPGFAKELAKGVRTNQGLTSLDVSNNTIVRKFWRKDARVADRHGTYVEDYSGIDALAEAIDHHTKLVSVNIIRNSIDKEHGTRLCKILKNHPTLKSVCGNKGNEQELIMSGGIYGILHPVEFAMLLAEIEKNKTLTTLKINGGKDQRGTAEVVQIKEILENRGGRMKFDPMPYIPYAKK